MGTVQQRQGREGDAAGAGGPPARARSDGQHPASLGAAAVAAKLSAAGRLGMPLALAQAAAAAASGEVPVGAVLLCDGAVVAAAHNRREGAPCPLAHAELLAIAAAAARLRRWRLHGCILVCSLEPCAMCAGAIVNARLDGLVFGAYDRRAGAAGSLFDIVGDRRLNHRTPVLGGVEAAAAAALLGDFFRRRRRRRRAAAPPTPGL